MNRKLILLDLIVQAHENELREAFHLNPGLEDWSKQDPDLDPIRGEPEYQSIYET